MKTVMRFLENLNLDMANLHTCAVLFVCLLCLCPLSSSQQPNPNLLEALQLLKKQQQNDKLAQDVFFQRDSRALSDDLRHHKLFHSNPHVECCPTVTELSQRTVGINPQGLVLDLFHNHNFTQTFYERICHPAIKDTHCQFIELPLRAHSRCVQEYSYVYAMGRTFGKWNEQYRIEYIRIASGCKCTILQEDPLGDDYMSNRIY